MTHSSRYLSAAAAVLATAWLGQGAALARTSTVTHSISTPRGTVTQSVTRSFTPSTRVASETKTVTRANGRTATVSLTSTPDGRGGFIDTRSVKTFGGQTRTATRLIGR